MAQDVHSHHRAIGIADGTGHQHCDIGLQSQFGNFRLRPAPGKSPTVQARDAPMVFGTGFQNDCFFAQLAKQDIAHRSCAPNPNGVERAGCFRLQLIYQPMDRRKRLSRSQSAASARSMSFKMSSASSNPTESLTTPSEIPSISRSSADRFLWVVVAG